MPTVLRLLGIACILPGLFHVAFGVGGDWLIGVPPAVPIDPSLDSQNRFYGAAFTLYGVLLWLCATDLERYDAVFKALLAVMFFGGCARGISALVHGLPTGTVMALWASEILLPPALWLWSRRRNKGTRR